MFDGAVLDHSPVVTPFGARFVTGAQGLGHVVLPATDPNAAFDFYTGVLGFLARGAWRLPAPPEFGPVRIRFFGVNERHHSLALVPAMHQGAPGLIHVMVEVDSLDAVGLALDRVNAEAFQLSSTLGSACVANRQRAWQTEIAPTGRRSPRHDPPPSTAYLCLVCRDSGVISSCLGWVGWPVGA